jgi:hypothetical protein
LSSEADKNKALAFWADMYLRKSDYDGEEIVNKALWLLAQREKEAAEE